MVTVLRQAFDSDDFFVEANSEKEAEELALNMAYNQVWGSGNSEYEVDNCQLVNAVKCSLCKQWVDEEKVHLHDGEYIGEECGCWDDRLRASE